MASVIRSIRTPLDTGDGQVRSLLEGIQGNILTGHGRDHAVNLFFSLNLGAPRLKSILSGAAKRWVTSAAMQMLQTHYFKRYGLHSTFCNLFLSASGYRKLGIDVTSVFPRADMFALGMKTRGVDFADPPTQEWEPHLRVDVDLLLLVAHDNLDELRRQAEWAIADLAGAASLIGRDEGHALRKNGDDGFEVFGFRDGISQPLFLASDGDSSDTTKVWNPVAPLDLVLTDDGASDDPNAFGSFYVYRKLEQNVRRFRQAELALAQKLRLSGKDEERAGAMVMGRFRDGTPLVESEVPTGDPTNDFRFGGSAKHCPFHAHIRRGNPRGDVARSRRATSERDERRHRIVRRGMPYGTLRPIPENTRLGALPQRRVGLLFSCFQSSIEEQFAFIQKNWMNSDDFVRRGVGRDPVVGQAFPGESASPQKWLMGPNGMKAISSEFGGFVRLKGGEFFFAPSLAFMETFEMASGKKKKLVSKTQPKNKAGKGGRWPTVTASIVVPPDEKGSFLAFLYKIRFDQAVHDAFEDAPNEVMDQFGLSEDEKNIVNSLHNYGMSPDVEAGQWAELVSYLVPEFWRWKYDNPPKWW